MKNDGKEKRPKKKPIRLVIQELTIKSDLLLGFERGNGPFFVNETTKIAKEFSGKINAVYSEYKAHGKKSPERGGRRWTHLEECLSAGDGALKIEQQKDFAPELGIHKNMIGDAKLLHDERRAGIDGVCRVLLGLGCFPWENCAGPDEAAEKAEEKAEEEALEEALRRMTDEERAKYMQELRAQRTQDSRELAESLRGYFVVSAPLEERIMEEAQKKGGQMTRQEAQKAARQALMDVRRIAGPFGYWMPDGEDDQRRRACIRAVKADVERLAGETEAAEKKPQDQKEEEKLEIPEQMLGYLGMTRYVVSTLYDPKGAWPFNPNRLRMIIAACNAEDGAREIERIYHAFGLHPAGLCDGRDGVEMYMTPYFPADQVVVASVETFRPMLESVMRRQNYTLNEKMSVFWGLLLIKLNHCDRVAYADAELGLRDALFSLGSLNKDVVDDLTFYWADTDSWKEDRE